MSIFYLLPPRPLLGDRLADFLGPILPGLDWDAGTRTNFAEAIRAIAQVHDDVYVIFREDLAEGETLEVALVNGFGAEIGDEVVEIKPGAEPGSLITHRWALSESAEPTHSLFVHRRPA